MRMIDGERHYSLPPADPTPLDPKAAEGSNDIGHSPASTIDEIPGATGILAWDSGTPIDTAVRSDYDPDFGHKVCERFKYHEEREIGRQRMATSWQNWRERVYGLEVATEFSAGNTPTELRDALQAQREKDCDYYFGVARDDSSRLTGKARTVSPPMALEDPDPSNVDNDEIEAIFDAFCARMGYD